MTQTARSLVLGSMLAALAAAPCAAQTLECSPVVRNGACTVTINRESPSTPQPFLMTGHEPITIVIRKRPFDKIEVNNTFTDVTPVDPLAAILGAFAPSFGGFVWESRPVAPTSKGFTFETESIRPLPATDPAAKLLRDLSWIATQQDAAKGALVTAKAALTAPGDALAQFAGRRAGTWTDVTLEQPAKDVIAALITGESVPVPAGVVAALGDAVSSARKAYAALGNSTSVIDPKQLTDIGQLLNQVDAHQSLLEASAKSLVAAQDGLRAARIALEAINASPASRATALRFTTTIATNTHGPARSVKSVITMTDALSKDKTDLGTVTASWNSTRWEVSAGTVFSTRPIRSYGVANSVITESNTRPMVVPFALAHYNLWETTAGRYRVALLASGGMGVNTNTKSADFGYGLSLSYRGVYLSALNHKARETVLSGGLVTGQTVASSVTTAPTELKWKSQAHLGIALTLRVPF
jgi:hypothetical protein